MNLKALCIGSSVLETTCVVNEIIEEGKNIRIENRTECGGGHAGNIAYLLSKWGMETYIASMVGADDAASKIKKEFEAIGTKIDYMETSYDKHTGQNIVFVNNTNKNKTVLELVSNSYLKKYAFGMSPDIIVSDGNDFNATVSALDKYPKIPFYLVITRYNNEIMELCKYGGNIIINKGTAETIGNMKVDYNNSTTLVNLYNKLKQKFNKSEIIITLGERGSVYSIGGQVKIMPAVRVGIVDTNGAGDVYAGAFIYGMGRNFGLEKSIAYATIASSMSTTKLTSRNSIPTLIEVSNYYDSKFGVQNNPYQQNNNGSQNNNMNVNNNANANVSATPNNTPNNVLNNNNNVNNTQNSNTQNVPNQNVSNQQPVQNVNPVPQIPQNNQLMGPTINNENTGQDNNPNGANNK